MDEIKIKRRSFWGRVCYAPKAYRTYRQAKVPRLAALQLLLVLLKVNFEVQDNSHDGK